MTALDDPAFVRALVASVGLALVAAPLGCVVVWRKMAYAGESLSQACLLGVALGLALNVNLVLAAIVGAVGAAMLLEYFGQSKTVAPDSLLGLFHHAALSLAVLLMPTESGEHGHEHHVHEYLFGDVMTVSNSWLALIAIGGVVILAVTLWLWKPLIRLTLHEDLATAEGMNPNQVRLAFALLLALTIAAAMKVAGVLLVMAFLVVPAVAARPFAGAPERMAILAAALGALSALVGMFFSRAFGLPPGPAIVATMCGVALLSLLAQPKGAV